MMARRLALLFLAACGTCMEMRESVERMVMVRTTGSDLQPAATGFIYKKDNDGPASVIKMEESDVMEHLSKLPGYKQPQAFATPIPVAAGPFYAKEDETKAASHASEAYVIPVVEKAEGHDDDGIDGIADEEDYGKIFKDYATDFGKYNSDFSDYLHSLGHYDLGIYHGDGGGSDYGSEGHHEHGDKGHKGYASSHGYGKGGEGDYHTEKYESYSISKEGGHKKHYGDADAFGKHYDEGDKYSGEDHGHKLAHSKEGAIDGYHKLLDKNEFKKDHDFYDTEGVKGGFDEHGAGQEHHGAEAGAHEEGGSHESGHDEAHAGEEGFGEKQSDDEHGAAHSADGGESSSHYYSGEGEAAGEGHGGKVYGYQVKH
ncbi:filaggrin-2-like [Cydia pomonella]|uniref:filaggrin-2-like n=1 Tax=Cydia pomonella TaxID=82600 RepID=UPI002ADD73A4|nr:filaggrin-2-like [Cydia pomonella]